MSKQTEVTPHVADHIEVGAILSSSWGFDQTNVDFYVVVRCTEKSAWILPLNNVNVDGDPSWAEHVTAGDSIQWNSGWCECDHRLHNHGTVLNMAGEDYDYCRGAYGEKCDCIGPRPVANKPELHRIQRWGDHESLSLTSYSSASLWNGGDLYASHYA